MHTDYKISECNFKFSFFLKNFGLFLLPDQMVQKIQINVGKHLVLNQDAKGVSAAESGWRHF